MVVFSSLRPSARGLKAVLPILRSSPKTPAIKQAGPVVMSTRGGAGRSMVLRPGIYLDRMWRDSVHFFILLGTIPVLTLATLANLFLTHGELTDLPEDRVPQTWEYHQHPITRFIAKNIVRSPEKLYETHMAMMYEQDQKRKLRKLDAQVKRVMLDRQDVRGWYFFQGATDARQMSLESQDNKRGTPF
ncbi:NADH dehydrogenase [ubiquinone] 1 beta subcomplex subunit 5, mitochondrial-like [Pecten maximus]|uniref:NADH dehydrogenase [ubiquinone] 1 beta subcomplex subunit 5, mitochondrial-like n=1 Tax=Pecten maximus TaxID=6579 RepID=UPI0014584773|nr:NADH dehydrogenase [ubiquinone] 1 beta subcomplex subunit 5, mitochondrial-like [Pecten maximus]